jgi:hypothetical protein
MYVANAEQFSHVDDCKGQLEIELNDVIDRDRRCLHVAMP